MKEIVVENTDGKIWHRDQIIMELVKHLATGSRVMISLNSEGPCGQELGLFDLLDHVCDFYQFDPALITISTNNLLEQTNQYKVITKVPFKGKDRIVSDIESWPYKSICSTTKHFGSFVGRGNRMRLAVSSYLYHHHRDKTLMSYHTDVTNPYFDQFVGLEEMMLHRYDPGLIDDSFCLLKQGPISLDMITQYPICVDLPSANKIIDRYPEIFVEIVYQPFCLGRTFFLDEKIWRTIGTRTPFIVQGPRYFLQNLKKLGFKTFDKWWDEGYSEDPPDYQVGLILEIINGLAQKSHEELKNIYEEMKPVLDHNHDRFVSLTPKDFEVFR
jgi:hypothetical protein